MCSANSLTLLNTGLTFSNGWGFRSFFLETSFLGCGSDSTSSGLVVVVDFNGRLSMSRSEKINCFI